MDYLWFERAFRGMSSAQFTHQRSFANDSVSLHSHLRDVNNLFLSGREFRWKINRMYSSMKKLIGTEQHQNERQPRSEKVQFKQNQNQNPDAAIETSLIAHSPSQLIYHSSLIPSVEITIINFSPKYQSSVLYWRIYFAVSQLRHFVYITWPNRTKFGFSKHILKHCVCTYFFRSHVGGIFVWRCSKKRMTQWTKSFFHLINDAWWRGNFVSDEVANPIHFFVFFIW